MKYQVTYTNKFLRDYAKMQKRGKDMSKLEAIVKKLENDESLEPKHRLHILKGKYHGFCECHIEPDWLLVWLHNGDRLILTFTDTGSHSDLFR